MHWIEEVDGIWITDEGVVVENVEREGFCSCYIKVDGEVYEEDNITGEFRKLHRDRKK